MHHLSPLPVFEGACASTPSSESKPQTFEALAKRLSAVFRQHADVHEGTAEIELVGGRHYFTSGEGSASAQPVSFVKRLYADEREELVRGAIFAGPTGVKGLAAMGSAPSVYSWGDGPSGSESAITAPALLFSDVAATRSSNDQVAPLIDRPTL